MVTSVRISSRHDVVYDTGPSDLNHESAFIWGAPSSPSTAFPPHICSTHTIMYEAGQSSMKTAETIITGGPSPDSMGFAFQTRSNQEIIFDDIAVNGKSNSHTRAAFTKRTGGENESTHESRASTLKEKTVLITGGALGIGAAIAKEFAENACVTVADLNEELGKTYKAELNTNFVRTDVTSWPSQIAAFKSAIAFGIDGSSIDIVIASAGLWGVPFLPNDEAASLDKDPPAPPLGPINVNLIGLSYTAKLAPHYFSLPSPDTTSDKTLILIGSSGGYLKIPLAATYNASKWGVRGLFRTIREPLAAKGIRVNLIAPWLTDTPMSRADSPAFKAVDLPIADPEVVIKAAIRCAVDASIVGRAFAVGPRQTMDLTDDEDGNDGALVMKRFVRLELPGYKEKIAKVMKMFGF